MTENILEEMTNRYNQMTRSGKLLANYIFANTEKAQYLSITSLAENCGVSEATITRFCRMLGLSGYNDLKLALAKTAHPNELGEFSDQPQGIITTDTAGSIGKKLRDAFFVSVNETLEQMDPITFSRAVMYLHRARQVFCFGQGGNTVLAQEAWARFSQVTNKFIHIADSHMQIMATSCRRAGCNFVFFLLRLYERCRGAFDAGQKTPYTDHSADTFPQFYGSPARRCHPALRIQRKSFAVRLYRRKDRTAAFARMPLLQLLQSGS